MSVSPRFSLVLALLLAAAPSRAAWTRSEWLGLYAGNGHWGARVLDFSIYESRYGLGVGLAALDIKAGGWDAPRAGLRDASAHYFLLPVPLRAQLALHSWKGGVHFYDTVYKADRAIGRLELFGSYCGWASQSDFTERRPNILGDPEKVNIPGSLRATVTEYGLRADMGRSFWASVGRMEFRTRAAGQFRARYGSTWYGQVGYYIGVTRGDDYGGGAWRLPLDAWDWLRGVFGGSVVSEH
jgi:hypothetical protein